MRHRQRCQEGGSIQDPSKKIVAPWTFSIKFPYDTQCTFRSLMFAAGEDGNLELLTRGPAPKHLASVYGQAPYLPTNSSISGGACSGLNPYAGPYYLTTMTSQGLPIGAPIFQPSVGTANSSSSGPSPDRDSTEDYPEIGSSTCWNTAEEGGCIIMLASVGAPSQNSSSRYPIIRGSEASDAWTPSDRLVRNLNQDFNVMRLQTIIESIQCMTLESSPLNALAQQGVEVVNQVIAVERSTEKYRGEPFIGNQSDSRAKRVRSEATL
jgi:hypothetical protein